ncbi:hypothetical protein ABZ622_41100 [Streptomyces sp. NPDC007164]|uniref:hypothetical protein n=1 Tax=Streptomyces sp. NPDC007164 TaxID=3156918 RepID=UPI0033E6CF9B
MLLSPTAAASPPDDRPALIEVSFTGVDGVRLNGTVLSPTAGGRDRPALVMVPGAGPGGLALGGAEAFDVGAGLAQGAAGVAPRGAGLVWAGSAFVAHPVRGRAAGGGC